MQIIKRNLTRFVCAHKTPLYCSLVSTFTCGDFVQLVNVAAVSNDHLTARMHVFRDCVYGMHKLSMEFALACLVLDYFRKLRNSEAL